MGILIRTMRGLPCEDTARLAFCHLVGASNQNQSLLIDWSQTPNFGTVKKKILLFISHSQYYIVLYLTYLTWEDLASTHQISKIRNLQTVMSEHGWWSKWEDSLFYTITKNEG